MKRHPETACCDRCPDGGCRHCSCAWEGKCVVEGWAADREYVTVTTEARPCPPHHRWEDIRLSRGPVGTAVTDYDCPVCGLLMLRMHGHYECRGPGGCGFRDSCCDGGEL